MLVLLPNLKNNITFVPPNDLSFTIRIESTRDLLLYILPSNSTYISNITCHLLKRNIWQY